MNFNWQKIRNDFPILSSEYNGKKLVYLDNSATSQKPQVVIDAITELYSSYNANIHRGVYRISEKTTYEYELSKKKVASFIHAPLWQTVIYTRNTSESLNIAALLLERELNAGDEIIISIMEHHSNLIPWMKIAERKNCKLLYIPITSTGELDQVAYKALLSERTKIVALSHVSNVLGTINPIKEMTCLAKEKHAYVVIDGAQAVGTIPINVFDLDIDFYAFSGHKMLAPTGTGVLYGKEELLNRFDPVFYGGDMISHVEEHAISYNELPWKFEAGTSNYEGGIALGIAIDYLEKIGIPAIEERKKELLEYATHKLKEIEELIIYGNSNTKTSVISFSLGEIHPHDIASILNNDNICIRAGHHCAEPLVNALGKMAVARVSLNFYNNTEDIDLLIAGLKKITSLFSNGR